jgi:outer membrane protein OmpA-like peptidoglycan-associated protein
VYAQREVDGYVYPFDFKKLKGSGLQAEYMSRDINFLKAHERIDTLVDFEWNGITNYPAPQISMNDFVVSWKGFLYAPKTGKYTIYIKADDGIRCWIGEELLINQWKEQPLTTHQTEVKLKSNLVYEFQLDYMQVKDLASVKLYWQYEKEPKNIIPTIYLFPQFDKKKAQKIKAPRPVSLPNVTLEPVEFNKRDSLQERVEKEEENFENIEARKIITLNNIFFKQGEAILQEKSYIELDKLTKALDKNPNIQIEIAGHTDNIGDVSANLRLSRLRAVIVANYLIANGIAENRITANGYGSAEPIDTNDTEEGRRKNRRVEIRIK